MHRVSANGANIPAIGLGTWTLKDRAASELVEGALTAGYRHIDTAAMYQNEEAVGAGVRASGLPRDEVFLTSKVWPTDIAEGDLQRSVEASLKRLGVGYLDLALIHWPSRSIALAESIKALNEVRDRGMVRSIGVSNFTSALIEEAVALSEHPLACNQVEYHPFLNQDRVMSACKKHGMALVSYCPLARGSELFESPEVAGPAQDYGKSPAQIVLRWHVQQDGVVAIPRSSNAGRIKQNFEIFDFALTQEEMTAISALRSRNYRICDFEFSPDWDQD
ncbi:aldo/keto reductase [Denitrobaculum tricleocarpae]|uniref:Aldo/keto reductase n=1 Tax=Denitrobaculum tricleocarpae TaxID=2591009 RepID=A0A545TG73_9PROT|nr:aldo/keto reductase [Denitrobaculum tricleocarpae]TQV76176.1 aldo/keto reductase [Denitrobaculum tricleocarpae]